MGAIASAFATVYRDYVTEGVASSGVHKPRKDEIRAIGVTIESALSALGLSGLATVFKDTRANLNADLAHAANIVALVYADATDANNDLYIKVGGSGSGSWTLTSILHDLIETAAADVLATAAGYADDAAASLATFQASETVITNAIRVQRRLHELAAQTGGVPRGFVDLADIGIADYPNDYAVQFYSTGTQVWPMRKLADIRDEWRDGDVIARYPVDGDMYASISIAKSIDPTLQGVAFNTYHTNYAIGADSGAGATEGAPWKRPSYAITNCVEPALILVHGDWVGSDAWPPQGYNITKNIKIKAVPITTEKTAVLQSRESATKALFAWVNNSDGSFTCTIANTSIGNAIKNAPGHFDLAIIDADGAYCPMKVAADKTACRATPNTTFCDTTGAVFELTVHRLDGEEPDPGVNWAYTEVGAGLTYLVDDGKVLFFEGFNWCRNDGAFQGSGIYARARSVTVPGPRVEKTGVVMFFDCGIFGASSNAVLFYDIARGGAEYCVFKYCRDDGFNGHSFYTYGNVNVGDRTLEGRHIHLWCWNNIMEHFGDQGFKSQPALVNSSQAVTTHDQVRITFGNCVGGYTNGSTVAVVNGGYSFGINSMMHDPTIAAGGAVPKAANWVDGLGDAGVLAKLRLAYCSSRVASTGKTFAATNGGLISHYAQKGQKTVLTGTTGTVTDLG